MPIDYVLEAATAAEMLPGSKAPRVSIVIPTRNRPTLVARAVHSALNQTLREIEVVVIIDGPDNETRERLDAVQDDRLRVLTLADNVGGSEARNIGVRYSRGKWIAFLDDDDEWLPDKLSKQWIAGESMAGNYTLVACQFLERAEDAERVLPLRTPRAGEAFSDYLFARRGWSSGEGFLQTSTWFVSRPLITRMPFTRGLKRCQDLDWLLRATSLPEATVTVVPEVLAIFHHDERPERVSRTADWRFLYDWAFANQRYFTPRAFAFFIATYCGPSAAKEQEGMGTFLFLLFQGVFRGRPTCKCLLFFLICWWLPESRRRWLRASVASFGIARASRMAKIGESPMAVGESPLPDRVA